MERIESDNFTEKIELDTICDTLIDAGIFRTELEKIEEIRSKRYKSEEEAKRAFSFKKGIADLLGYSLIGAVSSALIIFGVENLTQIDIPQKINMYLGGAACGSIIGLRSNTLARMKGLAKLILQNQIEEEQSKILIEKYLRYTEEINKEYK